MELVTTVHYKRKLPARLADPPAWLRIILLIVLGYEGAGALLGGILLIAAPDGRYMEMPVDMMHGAFNNFLVPGIILLALGILNAIAFVFVIRKSLNDWLMAALAMGGLLIWFVVEIIILRELHWLHLMWGLPVLLGCMLTIPLVALRHQTVKMQKGLLFCGVLSSLWYIAINIYVPMQYDGYSMASYTVSELSALDTPTRILWVLLALPYPLLFGAFGWGVLQSAPGKHLLRLVGYLIIAYCLFNFYWPPMHMRGNEPALTDTLHIAWAVITNIFMWFFMVLGAAALGRRFRNYTIASIALHILFGILTFLEAPNIAQNGPTPMIGIWERINIFIFMLWVIVFGVSLLKRTREINSHAKSPRQPLTTVR